MLICSTTPLGNCVDFSVASNLRFNYLKKYVPSDIDFANFAKVFKRDIVIDSIIDRLSNVNVYYIESIHGRGDELYYFSCNGRLFHGEKIWSEYHPFISCMHKISPSAEILDSSWFVGSRNNYTHQLIDFLPNLIYRAYCSENDLESLRINIFGKPNKILQSVTEYPVLREALNSPKIFLEEYGTPVQCGSWRVRCIKFRELYLIKHLSIFKAFSLIHKAFNEPIHNIDSSTDAPDESILYLSRSDNRVLNQDQIVDFLSRDLQSAIIKDIYKLSFAQKKEMLSSYGRIILPPGSDNMNALCFSHSHSLLFQLIPVPIERILDSPFTSYASLRYLLPFLHRVFFIPCDSKGCSSDINAATWSTETIKRVLSAHNYGDCLER